MQANTPPPATPRDIASRRFIHDTFSRCAARLPPCRQARRRARKFAISSMMPRFHYHWLPPASGLSHMTQRARAFSRSAYGCRALRPHISAGYRLFSASATSALGAPMMSASADERRQKIAAGRPPSAFPPRLYAPKYAKMQKRVQREKMIHMVLSRAR